MRRTLLASLVVCGLLAAFAFGQYYQVPPAELTGPLAHLRGFGFQQSDTGDFELLPPGVPSPLAAGSNGEPGKATLTNDNAHGKKFSVDLSIYEGNPSLTLSETRQNGKAVLLLQHQLSVLENRTSGLIIGGDYIGPPEFRKQWRRESSRYNFEIIINGVNDNHFNMDWTLERTGVNGMVNNNTTIYTSQVRSIGDYQLGEVLLLWAGMSASVKPMWAEMVVQEVKP